MSGPNPATTEWVPIWNPVAVGPTGPTGPQGPTGSTGPHHPTHEPGGSDQLANAAWTNLANTFTQIQTINLGNPRLDLVNAGAAVDGRLWSIQNNGNLRLGALNDAISAWIAFLEVDRAGNTTITGSFIGKTIVTDTPGNSLKDLTCGATNFTAGLTVSAGGASITGATVVNSLTVNSGGINVTGGGIESAFHIRAAAGLYDYGRGVPIGNWTDFTPVISSAGGAVGIVTNFACRYTLIGHTCMVSIYLTVSVPSASATLTINLPSGISSAGYAASPIIFSNPLGEAGMLAVSPGGTTVVAYKTITGVGSWPLGNSTFGGQLTFPIP